MDQRLPFQRSTSGSCLFLAVKYFPTAVHAVFVLHDTAVSSGPQPRGLAACWVDQLVPFQRSAKVARADLPTAVQALTDAHDTAARLLLPAPLALGVLWIDQRLPFQRSAKVAKAELPTAVQALTDAHDTAARLLLPAPLALGVLWIDHLAPFQRSTSGLVLPSQKRSQTACSIEPTAMQAVLEPHDTRGRAIRRSGSPHPRSRPTGGGWKLDRPANAVPAPNQRLLASLLAPSVKDPHRGARPHRTATHRRGVRPNTTALHRPPPAVPALHQATAADCDASTRRDARNAGERLLLTQNSLTGPHSRRSRPNNRNQDRRASHTSKNELAQPQAHTSAASNCKMTRRSIRTTRHDLYVPLVHFNPRNCD